MEHLAKVFISQNELLIKAIDLQKKEEPIKNEEIVKKEEEKPKDKKIIKEEKSKDNSNTESDDEDDNVKSDKFDDTKLVYQIKTKEEFEGLTKYLRNMVRIPYDVPLDTLYNIYPRLVKDEKVPKKIINAILKHYGDKITAIKNNLEKGKIAYEDLWYITQVEDELLYRDVPTNSILGIRVKSAEFIKGMFGKYFSIESTYISTDGKSFRQSNKNIFVYNYIGLLDIKDLPFQLMDVEIKNKLIERGKKYVKIAIGSHYKMYSGNILIRSWMGNYHFKSDGRIMLDTIAARKMSPRYSEDYDRTDGLPVLQDEYLWNTDVVILGFSFISKKWGEITVEKVSDIQFDETAFDKLVLDESIKSIIKAQVLHSNSMVKDIIVGKGSGCILLLHGVPGVGKTLTAEAIAELLKKPLYIVGVGELGVNPEDLESNLTNILQIASNWNAIVLLDEADIFLEKRNETDIKRNAMVGIFLRLLEYYNGIMFLTTNKVKNFDEAFYSRISITIHYNELNRESRVKIWNNFLKLVNHKVDIEKVSEHNINGRQIRSSIKSAEALASAENPENPVILQEHIDKILTMITSFEKYLKK